MTKIYNPICYSLYTDDVNDEKCLKRRFLVWDIVKSSEIEVFVCAEYFRLLVDKHKKNHCSWNSLDTSVFLAIEEAVSEYVPYWDIFRKSSCYQRVFGNQNKKTFANLSVHELIIYRPKIWQALGLSDCFQIILENPTKCVNLKVDVANTLINWSSGETFVKDKRIVRLVRDAFNITSNMSSNFKKYNWTDVSCYLGIDENSFIDLIVHLTNKIK
jgi:hypothetical protein